MMKLLLLPPDHLQITTKRKTKIIQQQEVRKSNELKIKSIDDKESREQYPYGTIALYLSLSRSLSE
jgi:hypothetical protein